MRHPEKDNQIMQDRGTAGSGYEIMQRRVVALDKSSTNHM